MAFVLRVGGERGTGPRVEESGLGLIAYHRDSAPYEDLKVRKQAPPRHHPSRERRRPPARLAPP